MRANSSLLAVALGVVVSLVPLGARTRPAPAPAQTAEAHAIPFGEWQWQSTRRGNKTVARPMLPEHYTLRFEPAGVLSAKLDCNAGGGKYQFEGARLTVQVLTSTRMACPPDSLDHVFQEQLAAVDSYVLKGGRLFLSLQHGAGVMEFARPAPPAPKN